VGWKVRLDVDRDDGPSKPSPWATLLGIVVVTLWIVAIAVLIRWVEGLLFR
jgi:hypothetical protein